MDNRNHKNVEDEDIDRTMDTEEATSMSAASSTSIRLHSPPAPSSNISPQIHPTGFVTLEIHPTTGGYFQLQMHKSTSIDQLKRLISRKLALAKDRICLLHRDRDLREGSLKDNQLKDGSKITLLPMVETGLVSQKPEQSVLQALESLSDVQVNTFLEGKAPLNLTMRLGDHMMFIQLQLSTVGGGKMGSRQKAVTDDRCPRRPSPASPPVASPVSSIPSDNGHIQLLDTRTLAEASRNLSHTLQHLSSQALYNRKAAAHTQESSESERSRRPGAIIESMHNHGRGVYSGTFSGTLNPALQDHNGNPKRDISTIVHILNDLLGASPHYRRSKGQLANSNRNLNLPPTQRIVHRTREESTQLSKENLTTRGKMEQLQQLLQERRDRRRARRERPYVQPQMAHWCPSVVLQHPVVESIHTPMESVASADDAQEYMKLKTETVVI